MLTRCVVDSSDTPLFVENCPDDNAGVVEVAPNLVAQGFFKEAAGAFGGLIEAWDVRLHQHAEFVCPVEFARLIRLDMDAEHVKARLLRQFHIVLEKGIVRRGVDAVGVERLIQHRPQIDGLAVQQHIGERAIVVRAPAHRADAKIAQHAVIDPLAVGGEQANLIRIKRGRVRRPELGFGYR